MDGRPHKHKTWRVSKTGRSAPQCMFTIGGDTVGAQLRYFKATE